MLVKVDWLSFTVKFAVGEGRSVGEVCQLVWQELLDMDDDLPARLVGDSDFTAAKGRAPYSDAFSWHNGGVTLFVHPALNHALFEISGKGCDAVLHDDWVWNILNPIKNRLTRIDVACDMLTDTRPLEFTSQRATGRFKSHSEAFSESGETCYIGSKTSNRYARVYRYNPPHERSMFLRSEFVLKAEDAKAIAHNIIQDGLMPVAAALGDKFGWLHPDWKPSATEPSEIEAYRPDRREGKTLFWLNDTIAPLLLRLHREGTIDAKDWFQVNVINQMTAEELAAAGLIPF